MDADLLLELSGATWVAATYLEEVTADLEPAGSELDFMPNCFPARQYVDHCLWMGSGWFGIILVGLCWIVHGVAILAAAISECYQVIRTVVSGAAELSSAIP